MREQEFLVFLALNCVATTWRRVLTLWTTVILLDFTKDVWTLPAPSEVTMDSVNMRHVLRWRPLQAACNSTLLYSVQYQGEFELLIRNGAWVEAEECQRVPAPLCDLTFDLGSDSSYSLRVRAQCGERLSAWTRLSQPFNRRDTALTAPRLMVVTAGGALQVSFSELPLTATASVKVWREDGEHQAVLYRLPAEQQVLQVAALQAGGRYCVSAQLLLQSGLRSASSAPRCLSLPGPDVDPWRLVGVAVGVVVLLGLMVALSWSIVQRRNACRSLFTSEPLPQSLVRNPDVQMLVVVQREELTAAFPELLSPTAR